MIPLDELELFELFRVAYPEKFKDDSDETWDTIQDFVENLGGTEDIADLLGRVVMLAGVVESELTKKRYHVLGSADSRGYWVAAVTREEK